MSGEVGLDHLKKLGVERVATDRSFILPHRDVVFAIETAFAALTGGTQNAAQSSQREAVLSEQLQRAKGLGEKLPKGVSFK